MNRWYSGRLFSPIHLRSMSDASLSHKITIVLPMYGEEHCVHTVLGKLPQY